MFANNLQRYCFFLNCSFFLIFIFFSLQKNLYFCSKFGMMNIKVYTIAALSLLMCCTLSCRRGGAEVADTAVAGVDSVPGFAVEEQNSDDFYGDDIVFDDETPDNAPAMNVGEAVAEPDGEAVQQQPVRPHKPFKRGKSYKAGFAKGYEQGKHDAIFCESYHYGFNNRSSYVGTEANDYAQGYRDGYDEAYNCNFQISSNPQNPAWN